MNEILNDELRQALENNKVLRLYNNDNYIGSIYKEILNQKGYQIGNYTLIIEGLIINFDRVEIDTFGFDE